MRRELINSGIGKEDKEESIYGCIYKVNFGYNGVSRNVIKFYLGRNHYDSKNLE